MRIDLPGGAWAELKDVDQLTGADQDTYFDAYDAILAAKPQAEAKPDPDNPGAMLEPPRPRMTSADIRVMRDTVLGMAITAWSFDHIPLPYTAGAKKQLPLPVCNELHKAIEPLDSALAGLEKDEDPKSGQPTGDGGSRDTSPDGTASPLPEPPEDTSGTP